MKLPVSASEQEIRSSSTSTDGGAAGGGAQNGSSLSVADEILKLHDLRKLGVLSGAEFDEQKRRVLAAGPAFPAGGPRWGGMSIHEDSLSAPPTYLAQAILVTLFCFPITGIVAILKASKVTAAIRAGSEEVAWKASEVARRWVIFSVVAGLVTGTIYVFS